MDLLVDQIEDEDVFRGYFLSSKSLIDHRYKSMYASKHQWGRAAEPGMGS